jgi:ornithine cyclodeaminase/alanine dehydrogenase-like protein (mu-crystallin family)
MYQIMTDEDVNRILQIETVVNIIEQTLRARAEGALVAPPRFSVELGEGALVFTAGAERKYARAMGFRVYDTFPHSASHQSQFVAILDSGTGELRGLVIGKGLIGALRTAAINAVAIKHMARLDAEYLGILEAASTPDSRCGRR